MTQNCRIHYAGQTLHTDENGAAEVAKAVRRAVGKGTTDTLHINTGDKSLLITVGRGIPILIESPQPLVDLSE